jgi:hypothetical protein
MLYSFRATVQYTLAVTSSSLHNIYYSLLPHVSATGHGHVERAANFTHLQSYTAYVASSHIVWPKHAAAVNNNYSIMQRIGCEGLCQ